MVNITVTTKSSY